jgi:hypothetical protein
MVRKRGVILELWYIFCFNLKDSGFSISSFRVRMSSLDFESKRSAVDFVEFDL